MLAIFNVETLDSKNLKVNRKKTKKTQIVLYDTQRRFDDYINKLKHRRNGAYEDIPHFVVSKMGNIYQIFDTNHSSVTFNNPDIDKKIIKIAIENLGWLQKNTINGYLFNWIGDPYRSEPYTKNWRSRYFWDKYNDDQMVSVSKLCDFICEKHKIKKEIFPSQGLYYNVPYFQGVVCKSNFSDIYTDINPSFNFNLFFKNAE
jgi:N-acetyl-anhydromuramyl-L-alanine amidase AmpD